ncbi:PqqD family protein [Dysgonomonas sp. 511]|uniref:PqqD family protein n=1 Tax=Dysgonomonas sp. 511 TaxID=2302930 RepID=UPI0013D38155|nr:PqqD family protein [Dysgonomonas sp. 511]NDV78074.1 PqqD family protein [Dysgonomonas sp. 511]
MRTKKEIVIKDIAGERVAIRQGRAGADLTKIIAFNPSAEWLWHQLSGKDFSEEDVIDLLMTEYSLDKTTATADAKKWLDQCIKAEIIDL